MNKKLTLTVILALLLLAACRVQTSELRGSGTVITEERPLDDINSVTLATLGDLTIELGEPASITIEAEDNLLSSLETKVRSGKLTIGSKPGVTLQPTKPVRYQLTVPSLEALTLTSSGNAEAPALQAGTFSAHTSSSGNLYLAGLEADRLSVEITSNGNIEVAGGQVGEQTVDINSSGDYLAGDLRSEEARVKVTSSGSATVWVADSLNVTLSSSGSVNYYGQPVITQSVSSSGGLVSLGVK